MTLEKIPPERLERLRTALQMRREPWMQLTSQQFARLKKDLQLEKKQGPVPKIRAGVVQQVMAAERVKGNYLNITRASRSTLRVMLKKAETANDRKGIRLYNNMLATLEKVEGAD